MIVVICWLRVFRSSAFGPYCSYWAFLISDVLREVWLYMELVDLMVYSTIKTYELCGLWLLCCNCGVFCFLAPWTVHCVIPAMKAAEFGEAFAVAPATLIGFTDMFVPALLITGVSAVKTNRRSMLVQLTLIVTAVNGGSRICSGPAV